MYTIVTWIGKRTSKLQYILLEVIVLRDFLIGRMFRRYPDAAWNRLWQSHYFSGRAFSSSWIKDSENILLEFKAPYQIALAKADVVNIAANRERFIAKYVFVPFSRLLAQIRAVQYLSCFLASPSRSPQIMCFAVISSISTGISEYTYTQPILWTGRRLTGTTWYILFESKTA